MNGLQFKRARMRENVAREHGRMKTNLLGLAIVFGAILFAPCAHAMSDEEIDDIIGMAASNAFINAWRTARDEIAGNENIPDDQLEVEARRWANGFVKNKELSLDTKGRIEAFKKHNAKFNFRLDQQYMTERRAVIRENRRKEEEATEIAKKQAEISKQMAIAKLQEQRDINNKLSSMSSLSTDEQISSIPFIANQIREINVQDLIKDLRIEELKKEIASLKEKIGEKPPSVFSIKDPEVSIVNDSVYDVIYSSHRNHEARISEIENRLQRIESTLSSIDISLQQIVMENAVRRGTRMR